MSEHQTAQAAQHAAETGRTGHAVAGYFIRIPEQHVPELAQFLAERNVEFDPVENLTACHLDVFLDKIWTGHYGQDIVDDINDHLEVPSQLRITQPFNRMSASQQWHLLMYATLHCDWAVDYDRRELEYTNIHELENLKEELPQMFAK